MGRPRKNPISVDKTCDYCEKTYPVKYTKRNIQKYCSKKCAGADPRTKQKIIENQQKTYDIKYDGKHPMQTEGTKVNLRESLLRKYKVTHFSKIEGFNEMVKATKLERYGDENYQNWEKIKRTCISRYGVDNPMKSRSCKAKSAKTQQLTHYNKLIPVCDMKKITLLCDEKNYKGYHFKNKYTFECNVCHTQFESTVYNLTKLFCEKCHPLKASTFENTFYSFLLDILPNDTIIKRRDRSILYGKELDFYIPSLNVAFECNGLYWHSEAGHGINRHYHVNKTKLCAVYGIQLVHIFENEWNYKRDIVKSIISNLLNTTPSRVFARKCEIRHVTPSDKDVFLADNHLQGPDKSSVKLGLYHTEELVSLMTFRKSSRFDKHVEWELMRFCNKRNTVVMGGAARLFKRFIQENSPKSIVSYSDRRYFTGEIYQTLNFTFIQWSPPGYHYIIEKYKDLKNRMSFQKHKLEKILPSFDPSLTEWENMKNNGYDRIWDCGNSKWIWKSN
jgi:hypothetical protein